MTIKELCSSTPRCRECEFYGACPYSNEELWGKQFYDLDVETDKRFTEAIIETARILTEGINHGESI